MQALTVDILSKLTRPHPRLPWISTWLEEDVWSPARFAAADPEAYLTAGEQMVNEFEELLATASPCVYDELAAASIQAPSLQATLSPGTAVVVFDGASLRETPLFLQKAAESGYRVVESRVGFAALPSTTTAFTEQRLIGTAVTPKLLPQRKELKAQGVRAYYLDDAITTRQIDAGDDEAILVWSAFPDNTYQNSDARFARHFAEMQKLFDAAWKNTVMQVPRGRRIVVTSDHGYVFFGAGFESTRPNDVCDLLEHDRARVFPPGEKLPGVGEHPELQVLPERRLAILRGRIKNRPKGPAGSRVYRHGGLSLMEMLVPWIVLEKE